MTICVEFMELPAVLAPALLYGDVTGLSADDLAMLDRVYAYVAPGRIVDVEGEAYGSAYCDLGRLPFQDVISYIVHYQD